MAKKIEEPPESGNRLTETAATPTIDALLERTVAARRRGDPTDGYRRLADGGLAVYPCQLGVYRVGEGRWTWTEDHRGRATLNTEGVAQAFFQFIGHPLMGSQEFTEAQRELPPERRRRLEAAVRVFEYAIQTCLVGDEEDWSNIEKLAASILSVRQKRVKILRDIEHAIDLFHSPAAHIHSRDEPLGTGQTAWLRERAPFRDWPVHQAWAVHWVAIDLCLTDDGFYDRPGQPDQPPDPVVIHKWLARARPDKKTGAGNIKAPRIAAALTVAAGAFGDGRQDGESEESAIDRSEAKYRKADRDTAEKAAKKPSPTE